MDVYIEWPSKKPDELAAAIGKASGDGLKLEMIANRGVKVWPDGSPKLCAPTISAAASWALASRPSRSSRCSIAWSASASRSP